METRTPDLQPALLCVLSAAIDEGSKLRGGSLGIVPQGWEQSSRSLLPATQPVSERGLRKLAIPELPGAEFMPHAGPRRKKRQTQSLLAEPRCPVTF